VALNISNETKVGSLAIVAVTLLILGFNFLNGEELFQTSYTLTARYKNIDGLIPGNKVVINGLQVGSVKDLKLDQKTGLIFATFTLKKDILVPADSKAMIYASDLLGAKSVAIIMGKDKKVLKDGEMVGDSIAETLSNKVMTEVLPLKDRFDALLINVDALVTNLRTVLSDKNKANIEGTLEQINHLTHGLDSILSKTNGIAGDMKVFSAGLANQSANIEKTTKNITKFSDTLAASSGTLKQTLEKANESMLSLKSVMAKLDKGEGSAGLILNDKKLYENLNASTKSLDSLLVDLKAHPNRYLHFSVFGRKEKQPKP
jgi:phospholipid/cholesterol/gamma-HCH transport system substrate-binding protein